MRLIVDSGVLAIMHKNVFYIPRCQEIENVTTTPNTQNRFISLLCRVNSQINEQVVFTA